MFVDETGTPRAGSWPVIMSGGHTTSLVAALSLEMISVALTYEGATE
ncbi:MAG TPA: hypothetical protein VFL82_11315 [Thermomicrobiales bacterium]|nr:hypothetical protein [Thermomicrobiales bacterium]